MNARLPHALTLGLCLSAAACASSGEPTPSAMDTCKQSISKEFEIAIHASISDGDEDYKEHEGLKFGVVNKTKGFVQYAEDDPVPVENIQFRDVDQREAKFDSDAMSIERSELYVRDGDRLKTFCLLTPFSGLGSSGSFQNYAALIAVHTQDGRASRPVGEVVKRR